jgi:hypothetical protein
VAARQIVQVCDRRSPQVCERALGLPKSAPAATPFAQAVGGRAHGLDHLGLVGIELRIDIWVDDAHHVAVLQEADVRASGVASKPANGPPPGHHLFYPFLASSGKLATG